MPDLWEAVDSTCDVFVCAECGAPLGPAEQSRVLRLHCAGVHGFVLRCATCRRLEEYSRQAVMEGFPTETRSGRITFSAVNVEEAANRHFIRDYQLSNKSVVLQRQRGGRKLEWRNLNRIWELVGDQGSFLTYVRSEVSALNGIGP